MIREVTRKTFKIRYSGRSSDYITPSFGYGCLYKCAYCYMRRHVKEGLSVATNTEEILGHIFAHAQKLGDKIPNQTSDKFWTYDISCNEDFALHAKYHNWQRIFDFFTYSDLPILGTMATKYVNNNLLGHNVKDINGDRRIRIRFSLMPQELSTILEPNTSKIIDRIHAINTFYEAGYDVHINFSPVIAHGSSYEMYRNLFKQIDYIVDDSIKENIKAEVIFLTHNKQMHEYNLENNPITEALLWCPERQEDKVSTYGGKNIRYKHNLKRDMINKFVNLHDSIIAWNKIRYIF
jgi:spore photoproduct lyase